MALYNLAFKSFNIILFFIIQDCVNPRQTLFYLWSYLATIFLSFLNTQVITLVNLMKLRQNQLANELF